MHLLAALVLSAQVQLTAELALYEFWRPPDLTSVSGVLAVPLAALTFVPDPTGQTRTATYRIGVEFHDATGTVLHRTAWSERVSAGAGALPPGAQAVASLDFNLHPGRYDILVTVTDSVSGASTRVSRTIETTGERPLAGDLILATALRRLEAGEAPPQGHLVRSGLAISPNLGGIITGDHATISLFTEVYPPAGRTDTAVVNVVLRGLQGDFRQENVLARRVYPAAGGIETATLSLEGVPPGQYAVGLRIEYADTVVSLESGVTVPARRPVVAAFRLFDDAAEGDLDSIFRISSYLASSQEQHTYPTLSAEGKRRFLELFWARRDIVPGAPNEAYDEYRSRVAYANREFGTRTQPGWTTARGRIHITYGPPAERYTRPVTGRAGHDRPFEIWKYTGGRGDKYVFYDEAGFNNFQLVYTSNPNEPTMPGWQALFDAETIELIRDF
jgi:GWxTD domain-containing protein